MYENIFESSDWIYYYKHKSSRHYSRRDRRRSSSDSDRSSSSNSDRNDEVRTIPLTSATAAGIGNKDVGAVTSAAAKKKILEVERLAEMERTKYDFFYIL